MTPYLQDTDVTLYHGDAATVLARLPDGSVDCCVTSPPYFGLRDYGTATWEGGDAGCDHLMPALGGGRGASTLGHDGAGNGPENAAWSDGRRRQGYRGTCGKCGAVRHDVQIGLEPTPEEYVAALVGVFRQVWRVLAPWGTCFVNIGDSYASGETGRHDGGRSTDHHRITSTLEERQGTRAGRRLKQSTGVKPKDLLMMPARLALALQGDGWWVRSRIVWAKPNPMPESVTDRPTSAHEDVYLLTKAPRYYYDSEAVREPAAGTNHHDLTGGRYSPPGQNGHTGSRAQEDVAGGRNLRDVWSIATEPTPEAHFATFPLELVRRCLAAGCPERVCRECGEPSRRIVESEAVPVRPNFDGRRGTLPKSNGRDASGGDGCDRAGNRSTTTTGWTDCGCQTGGPLVADLERAGVRMSAFDDHWRPGIVLDPFVGSGKTCQQARRMGLHAVGIDASAEYLGITQVRLLADRARRWIAPGPSIAAVDDQLSLLAGGGEPS